MVQYSNGTYGIYYHQYRRFEVSKEIKQALFLGVFVALVFFLVFELFTIRGDVERALVAGISAVIGSIISPKIFKK